MNKRTFVKSLLATVGISLLPIRIFAENKPQSSINEVPVKIEAIHYRTSYYFPNGVDAEPLHEIDFDVSGRIYHNLGDYLDVVYITDKSIQRYEGKVIYISYKEFKTCITVVIAKGSIDARPNRLEFV